MWGFTKFQNLDNEKQEKLQKSTRLEKSIESANGWEQKYRKKKNFEREVESWEETSKA